MVFGRASSSSADAAFGNRLKTPSQPARKSAIRMIFVDVVYNASMA
jgi:hypothetical protein